MKCLIFWVGQVYICVAFIGLLSDVSYVYASTFSKMGAHSAYDPTY